MLTLQAFGPEEALMGKQSGSFRPKLSALKLSSSHEKVLSADVSLLLEHKASFLLPAYGHVSGLIPVGCV
jgi:hypothetical protein